MTYVRKAMTNGSFDDNCHKREKDELKDIWHCFWKTCSNQISCPMKAKYATLLFVVLFLLPVIHVSAQNRFSRYLKQKVVTISGGTAIPLGAFRTEGYAVNGVTMELTWSYKIWKNMGYMGSCTSGFWETDGKAREQDFGDPGIHTREKGSWDSHILYGGIFGAFPLSPASKFALEPRLLLGAGKTRLPEFGIIYPYGRTLTVKSPSRVFTYAAMAGITCKYTVSKDIYLVASADISWAKPVLNKVEAVDDKGYAIQSYSPSIYYPGMITTLSFKLGVGILVSEK